MELYSDDLSNTIDNLDNMRYSIKSQRILSCIIKALSTRYNKSGNNSYVNYNKVLRLQELLISYGYVQMEDF